MNFNQGFPGLAFCVGGRSVFWGGWSPQLLDAEFVNWPAQVVDDLKARYFKESSDQIGVDETNDFIYGRLHIGLRRQLLDGLRANGASIGAVEFSALPDHPVMQYTNPAELTDEVLRNWLGLPAKDSTPRKDLIGGWISDDTIWACTTCGYCTSACPVFIIPAVDKIIEMERAPSRARGRA